MLALGKQGLAQSVQGGHAHAAAHQHRGISAGGGVVAVAQAGEQIQLGSGGQKCHLLGAVTHHLIDEGQAVFSPVVDGNGAAEEFARQSDFHKLPGGGDGGGVAGQNHPVDILRQRLVGDNFKNNLFHGTSTQASMVEMVRVISSRTSSSTFTVSREVKMFTLYSVEIWRISRPSFSPAPGVRVLMT